MNHEKMDPLFAQGLRASLVEQVQATSPTPVCQHRWWLGAGIFAGVALIGGVGAATAGFFTTPGADIVTEFHEPVTGTYTGTQTIELGTAPDGATHIRVELTCLSGGTIYWQDGASMTCQGAETDGPAYTSLPLAPGQTSTEVKTSDPTVSYKADVTYENRTPTDWARNDNGDTYGIANDDGEPDLVYVFATNGKMGYAYSKDLSVQPEFRSPEEALTWQEDHRGENFTVPVYESDGQTVIGEFIITGPPELEDLP